MRPRAMSASPLRQEVLSNNDSLEISSDSANFHYMMRRNTNLKESMGRHELEVECSQTRSLMDSFRKQTRLHSALHHDGQSPLEKVVVVDEADDIDLEHIHISFTASTELPVQLPAKSDRTACTADVLNGYLKEFKENEKDRESTMSRAVDKLIDGPTLIYIFVRFSVMFIPSKYMMFPH